MAVEVYHWNPRRVRGRLAGRMPRPVQRLLARPVDNFGDLLGPLVVRGMLDRLRLDPDSGSGRLLSVGSVLHLARDGDVVWGSGVNGKHLGWDYSMRLDVRAVRGPLTRRLLEAHGHTVPDVFGDPALLLPDVLPQLRDWAAEPRHRCTVVPNLNDWWAFPRQRQVSDQWYLHPQSPVMQCLERIARSELVVASSLHAIVVAESLGIPARALRSGREPLFKYEDYYLGTGRPAFQVAGTPSLALELGGEEPARWDPEELLAAFPTDLWSRPTQGAAS